MKPRILLEEPIIFELEDGHAKTHAPMVQAHVGSITTRLILDTGSSTHLLTTELADRIGVEATPGDPGTDSTGASVPSWTLGDVEVRIRDTDLTLQDVVAIAAPEPFVQGGIGGILSPQLLHRSAWSVLDLANDTFLMVEGDETDVADWLAVRCPGLQALVLDRAPSDDPIILVHAAIEPFEPVITLLDTGGRGTEVDMAAVPGLVGGPVRTTGRGVGGSEALGSDARDQVLLVGDTRVPVRRLVLRDASRDAPALVGMDVLRGTVLAVSGDSRRPVIWLVGQSQDGPMDERVIGALP